MGSTTGEGGGRGEEDCSWDEGEELGQDSLKANEEGLSASSPFLATLTSSCCPEDSRSKDNLVGVRSA